MMKSLVRREDDDRMGGGGPSATSSWINPSTNPLLDEKVIWILR